MEVVKHEDGQVYRNVGVAASDSDLESLLLSGQIIKCEKVGKKTSSTETKGKIIRQRKKIMRQNAVEEEKKHEK